MGIGAFFQKAQVQYRDELFWKTRGKILAAEKLAKGIEDVFRKQVLLLGVFKASCQLESQLQLSNPWNITI